MRRVISVFLPLWPTDRWRRQQAARGGGLPEEAALVTRLHDGRRLAVGAADARARALGIRPGQPLADAQAMQPTLRIIEADTAGDARALRDLALWCQRYAPLTAADPPDGIRIDCTGAAHLLGGEAALMADLRARLAGAGISARLAMAETPCAAWGLARYAEQPGICPEGGIEAVLAPLPIMALRIPGETARQLSLLGLTRVGDLLTAPRAPLTRRFGANLLRQLDYARGTLFEPLEPVPSRSLIRHRLGFAEPLMTAEALGIALTRLARAVSDTLARRGEGARRLDLVCERVDHAVQVIALGTAQPVRDADHLARLLMERIETIEPGHGVEAMTLWVPLAEPLAAVQSMVETGERPALASEMAALAPLIDRLAARFGAAQVYRLTPVDSEVPERALARAAPLSPPSGQSWPAHLPRPVRLLSPPQPIQALALLPDQPPVAFTWARIRHRIRRADGPERIFGEWWRRAGEARAVRDYWAVEDEAGARFWLYRSGDGEDPATGNLAWFLHGVF